MQHCPVILTCSVGMDVSRFKPQSNSRTFVTDSTIFLVGAAGREIGVVEYCPKSHNLHADVSML